MIKKVALFLIVLLPCLWLLNYTWKKVNEIRATQVGWNSLTSSTRIDSLNQIGFRGKTIRPKKDTTEKIVLFVGDSQVEANGLPFDEMIENLVQKFLNQKDTLHTYKCYSIGAGGFGQDQEFLAMKEYFKRFNADKVLLWFTTENDVWNNIFPTHWPMNANPKPTYWLENGNLKGPNYQWLEKYPSPNKPLWSQPFLLFNHFDDKWESKLPPAYKGVPASSFHGSLVKFPALGGEEAIEVEKSHYAIFLSPRSERMKYGIQLTRFLIDSIRQLSNANHADFAMFTALNDEVTNMPDSSFNVADGGKVYTLSKAVFFENIDAIGKGFDFHFFRLTTEPKRISAEDNHHFNSKAQEELAHKIVDQILLP